VRGAYNRGNSCFLNALLQALAGCNYVLGFIEDSAVVHEKIDCVITRMLQEALVELKPASTKLPPCDFYQFYKVIVSKAFGNSYDQQDADELFCLLLESIENSKAVQKSLNHSSDVLGILLGENDVVSEFYPKNPFGGSFVNQMVCMTCGASSSLNITSYRVIPLPLTDINANALEDLLSSMTAINVVHDVECFGFCKKRTTVNRKCSLGRMPQTLCFHLGRLHFDHTTGRAVKLNHHVKFPLIANFSKYGFNENAPDLLLSRIPELDMKVSSTVMAFRRRLFELRSVIVHHGGNNGGHFTAFRCVGANTWYYISDDQVVAVTVAQVLASHAYMLFYERRLL